MISSRLLSVLRTFSHDEIRSFEKFLLSPFFNTNKNNVKFFRELKKFYPDYKSDLLTSEYIFGRMFTGKQYNKQAMWNLNSGLEKLAEEFLTHTSLIKKPLERFNLIFEELELRRLDKHYIKKLREMNKAMEGSKIDPEYFKYMGYLENYKFLYWQALKGLQDKDDQVVFNIAQINTLDYLVRISTIMSILDVNNENFYNTRQYSMAEDFVLNINFKRIIEISKKNKYKYADLIEFYCNVILCSLNPDNEKYFFKIKEFFLQNHDIFDIEEKKNMVIKIANYCVHKTTLGNSDYSKVLFDINNFRLKHRLATYDNDKINKFLYIQILYTAASLNKGKWCRKFIEEYTPLLFEEHRKSMKDLAIAFVFFSEKRYNDVLNSLNRFEYTDIVDKVLVKNLIARTHYEMKEFELLLYHIDSTKHFLKNNRKLGSFLCETNSRFYDYLHSLVMIYEKKDANKLLTLKERLGNENRVNQKIWLLDKLSELEDRK